MLFKNVRMVNEGLGTIRGGAAGALSYDCLVHGKAFLAALQLHLSNHCVRMHP